MRLSLILGDGRAVAYGVIDGRLERHVLAPGTAGPGWQKAADFGGRVETLQVSPIPSAAGVYRLELALRLPAVDRGSVKALNPLARFVTAVHAPSVRASP